MSDERVVLITEPDRYSKVALATWSRLGRVVQDGIEAEPVPSAVWAVVVRLGRAIDDTFLDRYPGLALVATPTTGLTHIDTAECQRRGVEVLSLQAVPAAIERVTATSELALGLLIAACRHLLPAAAHCAGGGRDRDRFRGRMLSRMRLGLIGLGRLGGHLARSAQALGMRVVAHDPHQADHRFARFGLESCDLDTLLAHSDAVSLHADLRPDNHGCLGRREIGLLAPGAVLVNTARGELVDEAAIAEAVVAGRLIYASDVLADEHGGPPSPLRALAASGHPGLLLTPHIGGCCDDAMHLTEEALAEHAAMLFAPGARS